jgi:hypothetical protein
MSDATRQLIKLETLKFEFGPEAATQKKNCLQVLKSAQWSSADQILRLHELLCFMQAWPDDEAILSSVDTMLARFDHRRDLKQHAEQLFNSGIAGTSIHFRFFAVTTQWLAERWPDQIRIDWEEFDNAEIFEPYLILLASYGETLALQDIALELPEWIDRLKGPGETDAHFVIRRLGALLPNEFLYEYLSDHFDIPLILAPGPGVPSRTLAKYEKVAIEYQAEPFLRQRPVVENEIDRPFKPAKLVGHATGIRLVDLARSAMVTRQRDLDAFAYADAHDVSIVDDGSLQFILYGVVPSRRFLLETLYGFLVLKNGVPTSYGAITSLFNSAEVAYTIFDTFRGGESTPTYVRLLALVHQFFGCDSFMIDPYQLGLNNDDALSSGAWWFYQKLGYRPRSKNLLKLMERELATMTRRRGHRSSRTVLKQLATENVYLNLGEPRNDVLGELELANLGLKIVDLFARRFGSDREQGENTLAVEAASRLGVSRFRGWSAGEKLAWQRWSPLIILLEDLERWPTADQEALVRLVRAKGARQELDYLHGFDGHERLRDAVVKLTAE